MVPDQRYHPQRFVALLCINDGCTETVFSPVFIIDPDCTGIPFSRKPAAGIWSDPV
ncbi:MAG: hypothetical protein WC598_09755 [Methanoregula sp.]